MEKEKIKFQQNNILKVTWLDAHSETAWQKKEDAEQFPIAVCESVGYFLNETKKIFRIADSFTNDSDYTVLAIPKGCIEKVEILWPEKQK